MGAAAIVQDLRRTGTRAVVLDKPALFKQARFLAQSARFESGQVRVPSERAVAGQWSDRAAGLPEWPAARRRRPIRPVGAAWLTTPAPSRRTRRARCRRRAGALAPPASRVRKGRALQEQPLSIVASAYRSMTTRHRGRRRRFAITTDTAAASADVLARCSGRSPRRSNPWTARSIESEASVGVKKT